MKKIYIVAFVLFGAHDLCTGQRLVDFVNPFIGTGGHGHTYPGATLPFGMVQVGPDNGNSGWDYSSGYHYADTMIAGFSHTHLSGTGVGDMCDISVLPMVGVADTNLVKSSFLHKEERASPGFYGVRLKDFKVYAEMTASLRCAMHRYAFPKSDSSFIRFNLGFEINTDKTTESYFKKIDDSTFVGYRFSTGWAKIQKVFFAVRLSKPVKSTTVFVDNIQSKNLEVIGKKVVSFLQFSTDRGEAITMKVGISFADLEGAVESLNEIRTWDFTLAKRSAAELWERELRKVQINTQDKKIKQIFYTSLYHTYLAPTIFSDRFGNYKGVRGEIYNGKMTMTTHSLWDVFRAAHPLLSITQTEIIPSIINSYLAFYDQYGYLPVWDLHFNETNTMTGHHAVPIIADAILKNMQGFDYDRAYQAMRRSVMQNIRGSEAFRNTGFLPADKFAESVNTTQEYAFDDWCLLQVARKLNKNGDTAFLARLSANWKNVFDESSGFFRGKTLKNAWVAPFDPYESRVGGKFPYTEGNAWQHSFFVPHDIEGLRRSYSTMDGLEKKLDSFFTDKTPISGDPPPDISGLMGQYAHGNEPSQHTPYLYTYLQKPWKTADKVREILAAMYNNTPDGLAGNEDCGQLSAWYVLSAIGFYPVNPCGGEFVFGSPIVDQAIILLPTGSTFQVKVIDNSPQNKYIQSITLNGKPYTKTFIRHEDMMKSGILEIKMGEKPGTKYGITYNDAPGSFYLENHPELIITNIKKEKKKAED